MAPIKNAGTNSLSFMLTHTINTAGVTYLQ